MQNQDLWPENITQLEITTPLEILRNQAALLGQKTNNLVEAEVVEYPPRTYIFKPKMFETGFHIVAPTLDNYQYKLFSIIYDIRLYPLTIIVDEDIRAEIGLANSHELQTEEEFVLLLKKIFNTEKTKRVIGTLLKMVEAKLGHPIPETQPEL